CEAVLRLYQEKYFDLNVRHFHEKLQEVEGIELSYTWVKQALQGAGLVARKRRRSPHRRRRPRREMPGTPRSGHLVAGSFADEFPFKLRKREQDVQSQPSE